MRVGVWFYGLATVVTGILDIVWGAFEASHQPIKALGASIFLANMYSHISPVPGWSRPAWRSCGERTERMGAAGSAIIYLVFALFWLPRFHAIAACVWLSHRCHYFRLGRDRCAGTSGCPGSDCLRGDCSTRSGMARERNCAGRWMLGVPPILFGLGHLINLRAYVPFVPHWVPFGTFWAVVTGMAFLLAGLAMVSGIRDVLAARLLALMLLLFEAAVEIPPVFVRPHSQEAWGGAVYNLTAIGACWIFAEFVAGRRQADQPITSASEHIAMSYPSSAVV